MINNNTTTNKPRATARTDGVSARVAAGDASWSDHGQSQNSSPRAVVYLRVSTTDQARRGGELEGFSIPAQREACERKAVALGASVVGEFAELGASAKTTDRPELQRLLAYVREQPVEMVIVHKLDRLSRSVRDNMVLWDTLVEELGVTIISCTEEIGNTPAGWLNFVFMSGIGEFHNRNLKTEVIKGMAQKAKLGGIPGKAPIGYLNVSRIKNDQVIHTVQLDLVRAPLVTWAFETYRSGEWPLRRLLDELTRRGLERPANAKRPAGPLSLSHLHRLLSHPFYRGSVRFLGSEYPGRHEPLVSDATWQQVQNVLAAHRHAADRQRQHDHPLKGTIFCGACRSRMIIANARSKSGRIYPYFVCSGRHNKRTSCTFRAVLIEKVEQKVKDEYANPEHQLTDGERQDLEPILADELATFHHDSINSEKRLLRRRERLLRERAKLVRAHLADAVPLDILKIEQDRIRQQLDSIEQEINRARTPQERINHHLQHSLGLLTDAQALYLAANDSKRRAITQALFRRIDVSDDHDLDTELAEPFKTLIGRRRRCLSNKHLVVLAGLLSNPPERLRKALDLYRDWQSEQRPDSKPKERRAAA